MAERSPTERDIVERHLARAWQALAPSPQLRELVRARLTSSTAATFGAIGLGAASHARPDSAWASLQASGKLGALVGTGLLALGLLSGYLIRDSLPDAEPALLLAPPSGAVSLPAPLPNAAAIPVSPIGAGAEAPRSEPGAATPRAQPSRPVRPAIDATPSAQRRTSSTNATAVEPSEELSLLRRADHAVRADNAALALALIDELDARYSSSNLLEERRAIELLAYCGVSAADASARAERFLRAHPSSVYAGRIRESCPMLSKPSSVAR